MATKAQPAKTREPGNRTITVEDVENLFEKYDQVPAIATTYEPEFYDDVYVIGTDSVTPVNELYCLTIHSAMNLMCILSDLGPIGYLDAPTVMDQGSHFRYSSRVPWLQFADGTKRNAAQLAQYWKANSGDPGGKTAEMHAREDIAWG